MSKNKPKLAVVGAGKMGEAIISGFLKSGEYDPQDIQVFEILKSRREYIGQTYNVKCVGDSKEAVSFADLTIVAVEPRHMKEALEQIAPAMKPGKIVVSIAAGVTLEFVRKYLPKDAPVVRVMPNITCRVGEAMIVVCPSENTKKEELEMVIGTLSLLGHVIRLDERYLNLATGMVGSGPAYIYLIIEAFADAGVRMGLPKDVSILLAAQTTLGAAKMVVETGEHPAKLKDMVATPAGTTVEGLLALEEGKLRAVTKAAQRAKQLQPS
ncbi:MAG: pyrroline-5-carboxylate reductase [Candidatus Bathyarchaeota archaeon]|nr:pyrroline-5-carboxylate reductase [Candidatus Bathyarchaeota archaeon]